MRKFARKYSDAQVIKTAILRLAIVTEKLIKCSVVSWNSLKVFQ